MANIPVNIDPRSTKGREVTIIVYVDGKEYSQETKMVPEYAIPHVVGCALAQVEDPDEDGAIDAARDNGTPLPEGY